MTRNEALAEWLGRASHFWIQDAIHQPENPDFYLAGAYAMTQAAAHYGNLALDEPTHRFSPLIHLSMEDLAYWGKH